MKRYINRFPLILVYSFCLVGVSLFWVNLAEALFFDTGWWKEFETHGSILLYAIILFSIYWVIEGIGLKNYLFELSIEFCIFVGLYLIFGYLFHWYDLKNWWAMPIQCIPVFVIIYLFRLHHINQDISLINSKLNQTLNETD